MAEVVRLDPPGASGLDPALRERLDAAPCLFVVGAGPVLIEMLERDGLSVQPLGEGPLPEGCLILDFGQGGALDDLVYVIDRLLGPGGCPWDREQTHESLKRHLLEEAYEVLDAIDSGSAERLLEELGDLLLQPLMHAQMESLTGGFNIEDVARAIAEKLVRRHPHVFGDAEAATATEVLANWDRIKQQEKGEQPGSILAGVPTGMASLLRAYEVSKRAARSGFEWPAFEAVWDKLREEEQELREALISGDRGRIEDEVGDLLFTAVNIARWAKVEPEEALRKMLNRFTQRFQQMERRAERPLRDLSAEEWDRLWETAKAG
ncbi:MAG TPA: nucleoside triphosphate pyrophosphohydrolase [Fimbriimonadaceae bacterium]|nr:nucleoside triphosphate pyrophosphohydrolase [Fimbriimonadaceae bacterium]